MEFLQPSTWAEALGMKAAHPGALPIAGVTYTRLMNELGDRLPGLAKA